MSLLLPFSGNEKDTLLSWNKFKQINMSNYGVQTAKTAKSALHKHVHHDKMYHEIIAEKNSRSTVILQCNNI